LQVFFMLLLVAWMERTGASLNVARKIISIRFVKGRPWLTTLMLFFVAYIVSVLANGMTGALITWGFLYGILEVCQFTKKDAYQNIAIFGCVVAAQVGSISFPWQTTPIFFTNAFETASGMTINPVTYFLSRLPVGLGFILIMWAIMRWVLRPDVSKMVENMHKFEIKKAEKMTFQMKCSIGCLLALIIGMFLPGIFDTNLPVINVLKQLGIVGICAVCVILFSIIPSNIENGKIIPAMDAFQLIKSGINWNLISVMAVTVPLCNLLEADEAGVFNLIVSIIEPISYQLGPIGYVIFIAIFTGLLTQISHNMVLGAIITPILVPISISTGLNPLAVMMVYMLPINIAILTPAASGISSVMWGNTDYVETKQILKLAIITIIITIIWSCITMPWFLYCFK